MANKLKISNAANQNVIIFHNVPDTVGIIVSDSDYVSVGGRKIVKAGTPLTGNLENRKTAFTKTNGSDAIGILHHDVDVTDGSNNGDLIFRGEINLDRLDSATEALITSDVKEALKGAVFFMRNN